MITKTSGSNSWRYMYDYENRLKQVQLSGQNVLQALYDGDGRRITSTDGLATTIFHYRSGSWDPIYVNDLGAGTILDAIFAGRLRVAKIQAGLSYYYHLDRLGSVRLVTKDQNNQTFIAKYLPYGNPYATSGAERFQYTGKRLDVSTGLYYYGRRYYDSQLGVFLTLDPQQSDLQNPQALNRYSYALNNPNCNIDPDGSNPVATGEMLLGAVEMILGGFVMEIASSYIVGCGLVDIVVSKAGLHVFDKCIMLGETFADTIFWAGYDIFVQGAKDFSRGFDRAVAETIPESSPRCLTSNNCESIRSSGTSSSNQNANVDRVIGLGGQKINIGSGITLFDIAHVASQPGGSIKGSGGLAGFTNNGEFMIEVGPGRYVGVDDPSMGGSGMGVAPAGMDRNPDGTYSVQDYESGPLKWF